MNTPPSALSYSYEPFQCLCPHTLSQHALIRCGHPNDRPPTHVLHIADDAMHRVWCTECEKWCFSKRDDCPVFKDPKMKLGADAQPPQNETSTSIVGPRTSGADTCARM